MPADAPNYSIVPVSSNERDDELHIPYPMRGMVKGKRPQIGQLYKDIQFGGGMSDMDKFRDKKLVWIAGGGADATLIFADVVLPTRALEKDPSDSDGEWDVHTWHAVVRRQPQFYFQIDSGDFFGASNDVDFLPEMAEQSLWVTDVWWTTTRWPVAFMRHVQPRPGLLKWDYHGQGAFELVCLHPRILIPALSGVRSINGQHTRNGNIPGKIADPTNFPTWAVVYNRDRQRFVNGRYKRERVMIFPPYDPRNYPPRVRQFTSR